MILSLSAWGYSSSEYEFADGLRKLRYYDLAIQAFEKLSKDREAKAEEKLQGTLGMGSIYDDLARIEKDQDRKIELLEKARLAYQQYLKDAKKGSQDYLDVEYKLAHLNKDEIASKVDMLRSLKSKLASVPNLKDKINALEADIKASSKEALVIFEKYFDGIDKRLIEEEDKDRPNQNILLSLRQKKIMVMIDQGWCLYYFATIDQSESSWKSVVSKGEEIKFQFDGYAVSGWGAIFKTFGYLNSKDNQIQKNWTEEKDFFTSLPENKSTIGIILRGYHLVLSEMILRDDVILGPQFAQAFQDMYPRPPRVRGTNTKQLEALYSAVQLKTGEAFMLSEDVAVQRKGLESWVRLIKENRMGAYEARLKIKDAYVLHPDLPKFPAVLMAEAEGLIIEKRYVEGISSLQDAYAAASHKERKKYGVDIYKRMAQCHYWANQLREAALAFEFLADSYPNHKERSAWIKNAAALYGQIYKATKSNIDKAELIRASAKLPHKPGGVGDRDFMLAKLKESQKNYAEARADYEKVKPTSKHYYEARFKMAEMIFRPIYVDYLAHKKAQAKLPYAKREAFPSIKYETQANDILLGEKAYKALTPDGEDQVIAHEKYLAKFDVLLARVWFMQGNIAKAKVKLDSYLSEGKKADPSSEAIAIDIYMRISKQEKDLERLESLLARFERLQPDSSQIKIYKRFLGSSYLSLFFQLKKQGKDSLDEPAKKSTHYFNELLERGLLLSSNPRTHQFYLYKTGHIFSDVLGEHSKAVVCYLQYLRNLGEPVAFDRGRLDFPLKENYVRRDIREAYLKFIDHLIDDSDLYNVPSKQWKEAPVNYAAALSIAYDLDDTGKYVPGGKFKSSHKKVKAVLAEVLPEIIKRGKIIDAKEKLAAAYTKLAHWEKSKPLLIALDRYYHNSFDTKKSLATIMRNDGEFEAAADLFWRIRQNLKAHQGDWYDATWMWADCILKSKDEQRIEKAHQSLKMAIINKPDCPSKIKKLAEALNSHRLN